MQNPCDLVVTLELGEKRRVVTAREVARDFGDPGLAGRLIALLLGGPRGGALQIGPPQPQETSVTRNAFKDYSTRSRSAHETEEVLLGETDEAERVAAHLASTLRDEKSIAFYRIVARAVPRGVISDALTRAMDARNVRRSRGALFNHIVRPYLSSHHSRTP